MAHASTETPEQVQGMADPEILDGQWTKARVLRDLELQGEETSSQGGSDRHHRNQ